MTGCPRVETLHQWLACNHPFTPPRHAPTFPGPWLLGCFFLTIVLLGAAYSSDPPRWLSRLLWLPERKHRR